MSYHSVEYRRTLLSKKKEYKRKLCPEMAKAEETLVLLIRASISIVLNTILTFD